jgi:hypothetical protein
MKITLAVAALCSTFAFAQPQVPMPDWSAFKPLLAEWVADPGADGATGGFTLTPDLGGRVLVRKNVADYPKTKDRPAFRHEDLLVIFKEGPQLRATYWDNEGHRIEYAVAAEGPQFTFTSEPQKGAPQFRLTYVVGEKGALSIAFDIAAPDSNGAFKPYIKATAHKK